MIPDPWCAGSEHGSRSAYQRHGCRCTAARAEESTYQRERYRERVSGGGARMVDATATQQQLRELSAAGWPEGIIAGRLGVTGAQIWQWRTTGRRVHRKTAEKIGALYDELRGLDGPSPHSRAHGLRAGWSPPPLPAGDAFLLVEPDFDDELRDFEAALDAIDADDEAWFEARARQDTFGWRCWDWAA